jgi:hypothetical protein
MEALVEKLGNGKEGVRVEKRENTINQNVGRSIVDDEKKFLSPKHD